MVCDIKSLLHSHSQDGLSHEHSKETESESQDAEPDVRLRSSRNKATGFETQNGETIVEWTHQQVTGEIQTREHCTRFIRRHRIIIISSSINHIQHTYVEAPCPKISCYEALAEILNPRRMCSIQNKAKS